MVAASAHRFVALDSLRGIAALAVAGLHLHFTTGLFSSTLVRNADLAVDFFFVLSGFVIASSYGTRLQSGMPVVRFMGLRLGRLYPLYFVMLVIFLAQELVMMLPALAGWGVHEPFSGSHSPAKFIASLLLLQSFESPLVNNWNSPSWSIAVEVWLYLAAAVTWSRAGRRGWLVWLVAAIVAGSLLTWFSDRQTSPVSWAMLRGVLGFGLGVCSWEVWLRLRSAQPNRSAASLLEFAAIAIAMLTVLNVPHAPLKFLLAAVAFVPLVLVFALERGIVSSILNRSGFVWLGTLSYSIYMIHGLVIGRSLDVLRWLGFETQILQSDGVMRHSIAGGPLVSDLIGVGLLALSVGAAWFSWRLIEEPCRKWSRRRFASPAQEAD